MSAVYFSARDERVTMHLFIDEAEDLYTDLKVAIDNGNTSENIKAIVGQLEESIKVGRAYMGFESRWIKSNKYESRWFCPDCGWWSNEEPRMNGMFYCPGCGTQLIIRSDQQEQWTDLWRRP